jgi:hypothetical protein
MSINPTPLLLFFVSNQLETLFHCCLTPFVFYNVNATKVCLTICQ